MKNTIVGDVNKLEKLSETDESDFYEDSKCVNVELPTPPTEPQKLAE
tara:strand:+ start:403 stop:543 length:141 start_codon:yes stop_codon:yes gene_type:complete